MKKSLVFIASLTMIIGAAFTMTSCFSHGPNSKEFMEDKVEFIIFKLSKELDLSESQQEQLKSSIDEIHAKKQELHKDKEAHFNEIKKLIKSDSITEQELQEIVEEKHEKMAEIKDLVIEKLVEFHSTLTPEQKDKAVKLLEKHAAKFNK